MDVPTQSKKLRRGCLLGCLLLVVAAGGLLLFTASGWRMFATIRHLTIREYATITLPDGTAVLSHSRIGTNPIVAEYRRDITYIVDGRRSRKTHLHADTCGGYPINCYAIDSPAGNLLRLDDAVSEHLLDLQTQTTYLITRVHGSAYIGEFSDENPMRGWMMHNSDPSTIEVTVEGKRAARIETLTQASPESYIGRIVGGLGNLQFIPATEAAEMPINHLNDMN